MARPATLKRKISPPPIRKSSTTQQQATRSRTENNESAKEDHATHNGGPSIAAIEAGEAHIRDHLEYFAKHLKKVSRQASHPRLAIEDFKNLYKRNQYSHGRHFVVHQHDHPISGIAMSTFFQETAEANNRKGVHYDLRLQFSDTSTVSFAIPYGLPGNPHSIRPNRMCIETRVHNLWNNLIESASYASGSMLIWDTGEYEILPWKQKATPMTDEELSDGDVPIERDDRSQTVRLISGFQGHHIRLRLHGTRLPLEYTVSLRLSTAHDRVGQPNKPRRKRQRLDPSKVVKRARTNATVSDTDDEAPLVVTDDTGDDQIYDDAGNASDDNEDTMIRANNAYTGARNSIGSVHQRHWFLSLDRRNSGFHKAHSGRNQGRWVGGWEPFFVLGRDHERSIVTGRSADEVCADEDIEKFVGRKMWRPILE